MLGFVAVVVILLNAGLSLEKEKISPRINK